MVSPRLRDRQRTYIEQFFKILKHVLEIQESRTRDKDGFSFKFLRFAFIGFHVQQLVRFLRKKIKDWGRKIITLGKYGDYLKQCFDIFERSQIHIIIYHDMKKQNEKVVKELYEFSGVKPFNIESSIRSTKHNTSLYVKPSFSSLLKIRIFFMYRYNDNKTRLYKKSIYSRIIGKLIEIVLIAPSNNVKPVISNDMKQKIFNIYKEDIKMLEKLMDRNLQEWYI